MMNKDELANFIEHYGKDIYSFCRYLTWNRDEADDLYQETFLKVSETGMVPRDGEHAKTIFLSEAVRIWKDKQRKFAWRRRIREEKYIPLSLSETGLQMMENGIEEDLLRQERSRIVRECVNGLPEKLRLVVLLYYMEERRIGEIAGILAIPVGTVKSRLYQAKKLLERELSGMEDEV